MKSIDDKSIDMILCDLPYGSKKRKITWNNWDNEINSSLLFKEYRRIIKNNAIIVLTAMPPFSSKLIIDNIDIFKYEWVWEKEAGTGFLNAKKMPLRSHENILIFYFNQPTYNPQFTEGKPYTTTKGSLSTNYCNSDKIVTTKNEGKRYPKTIIKIDRERKNIHPTQKPIALFEYLIKTYTNEGDLVLDNCIGSGTTAIACMNTNRQYIGIEKDNTYFELANKRIEEYKIKEY